MSETQEIPQTVIMWPQFDPQLLKHMLSDYSALDPLLCYQFPSVMPHSSPGFPVPELLQNSLKLPCCNPCFSRSDLLPRFNFNLHHLLSMVLHFQCSFLTHVLSLAQAPLLDLKILPRHSAEI